MLKPASRWGTALVLSIGWMLLQGKPSAFSANNKGSFSLNFNGYISDAPHYDGVEVPGVILVISPSGKKAGETRQMRPRDLGYNWGEYVEIPDLDCGVYETDDHEKPEAFTQNGFCGSSDAPGTEEGEWKALITGWTESGYELRFSIDHATQTIPKVVYGIEGLKGLTRPGRVTEWRFNYSDRNDVAFRFYRVVAFSDGIEDLDIARRINWIDNDGILNSLKQKWNNAQKDVDRGNKGAAINVLGAFKNEVNAQKGKHLKAEAVQILLEDADYLIGVLRADPGNAPPSPPSGSKPPTPPGQDKKESPRP